MVYPATRKPSAYPVDTLNAILDTILDRLETGEPLRAICQSDGMPTEAYVRKLAATREDFGSRYARARSIGLDSIAEDIVRIADDQVEDPNSRKVRIDARKWLLSKMRPDKYGDKTSVELTGSGGGPVETAFTVRFVAGPSTLQPQGIPPALEPVTIEALPMPEALPVAAIDPAD